MSGLDALKGQAKARNRGGGRTLPPPRNKPRETPVELPAEGATPPQVDTVAPAAATEVVAPTPARPATTPTPGPKRPPLAAAATNTEESNAGVARATIYFDEETDQWLEAVIALGRRGSPKVSSKSAVARYAIRELARRMTPEAVIADMRQTAVNSPNQTGRPRL